MTRRTFHLTMEIARKTPMASAGLSNLAPAEDRTENPLRRIVWHHWLLAVGVVLCSCAAVTWGEPRATRLMQGVAAIAVVLAIRKLILWRKRPRLLAMVVGGTLLAAVAGITLRTYFRYAVSETMTVPVAEYGNDEYPEDPAIRSPYYAKYNGRNLTLIQRDDTHFDLVLEPQHPHVAKIAFRSIDVSLMTPGLPDWVKGDDGLTRIALTDRQWNRQQVKFDRSSPHLEIAGGDGFEIENLCSADLAKNCLNAGLWEVLLFVKEDGAKKLYYHGWFTFPLGHYKNVFERNTGLSYWKHWYYLEHWFDPAGTEMALDKLRRVTREREVKATFDLSEKIINDGCQIKKRRTVLAENLVTWGDFYGGKRVRFAAFIPPGRYSVKHPWGNEYQRMDRFEKAILRDVVSPATDKPLQELELVFSSSHVDGRCRFLVSGIDLKSLPQLPTQHYARGLYMPMGIGVPPFHQTYPELQAAPPQKSRYFSLLLDERDGWIDHHKFGIDGPVMHLDENDPNVLHVYLLSYERHSLVAHIVVSLPAKAKKKK
jgi:hypothetical protein